MGGGRLMGLTSLAPLSVTMGHCREGRRGHTGVISHLPMTPTGVSLTPGGGQRAPLGPASADGVSGFSNVEFASAAHV